MRHFLLFAFMSFVVKVNAQTDTVALSADIQGTDSVTILKLEDYLELVVDNHPVVRQAEIITASAAANMLAARGGFDPKVSINYDLKEFKEKTYYDLFNATLKVPTWVVEPKISVDKNEGQFVNEQNKIPEENNFRQVSTGVSIPVGRGLLMDQRRATLSQARIYQEIARADQNKMVNKILLTAVKDYWNWFLAYREASFIESSLVIASEIYERVAIDYEYGEAAIVDTVQAKITLQTRKADYAKVLFDLENARLSLATHLWSPEGIPLELQVSTIPDTLAYSLDIPNDLRVRELVEWSMTNHPEIQKLINKNNQLEVENRLNKEMLKPQLDVSYSFIDAPFNYSESANEFSFSDNYKLGVDFSFPLLLRKERGKIQKTNLKIQTNSYELSNQKLSIRNTILSKYAEIKMSQTLTNQYRDISENYKRLVDAEAFNLELGESDLFKFNIQLDKYISSQIKYLENLVKLQKNKVEILYESGSLFQEYN